MSERSTAQMRELLDSLYRVDSGRILAILIRLLGDFNLAEEAMHEAFVSCTSKSCRGKCNARLVHRSA
jgi:RNA polymerase sigma-70 factor (ECF subfamily)